MKDDHLFGVWQTTDPLSKKYSLDASKKIEHIHKKPSTNVLNQLIRNSFQAIGLGILLALISSFYSELNIFRYVIIGTSVLVSLWVTVPSYIQLKRKAHEISSQEIKSAIGNYILLMEKYIKRLKLFVFLFVPIVMTASIIGGLWSDSGLPESTAIRKILISLALATPFVAGFLLIEFKTYLDRKYLPYLFELKKMKEELEKNEG
jgi:hypothetical protein